MKQIKYAAAKKGRSKRSPVSWEIEHGFLKPDGTHSQAYRMIYSYRTEMEAREAWKNDTHWTTTEHSNNNYSILIRGRYPVSGIIEKKWIEVRYSKGVRPLKRITSRAEVRKIRGK